MFTLNVVKRAQIRCAILSINSAMTNWKSEKKRMDVSYAKFCKFGVTIDG